MRQELWPSNPGEHATEIAQYFAGDLTIAAAVFVACLDSSEPVGFIELSIRPYAEGCSSSGVVYVEGWFVDSSHRHRKIGAALLGTAEKWGRSQGCTEIASDAEIENEGSIAAHKALGFVEVGRTVCFRKTL